MKDSIDVRFSRRFFFLTFLVTVVSIVAGGHLTWVLTHEQRARMRPPLPPLEILEADGSVRELPRGLPGELVPLGEGRFLRLRPPHLRFPPPGKPLLPILAATVSVFAGLAISFLLITRSLRRKAREAGAIIQRLESGDLGARMPVGKADELTGITERFNRMADGIELLVHSLRETESSRRHLLQELAHDLRTPVASLRGIMEVIGPKWDVIPPAERQDFMRMCMQEIDYFHRLVEDLLFLASVDDPRYGGEFADVALTEWLEGDIGHLRHPLRFKLAAPAQALVRGNRHLLARLLKNALGNADRHARRAVEIGTRFEGGHLVVEIADDGPGFSADELASYGQRKFTRRFERDQTGHLSIGLGSVIIAKIMALHGGAVEAANRPEGGAVVRLRFPRA